MPNQRSVIIKVHETNGPPEKIGGFADRRKIELGRHAGYGHIDVGIRTHYTITDADLDWSGKLW
jgi:hypothetical protein